MNNKFIMNLFLAALLDVIILTGMLLVIKPSAVDNGKENTRLLSLTVYSPTFTIRDTKAITQKSETPFVVTLHLPTMQTHSTDDTYNPFPPLYSGAKWIFLGPSNQIITVNGVNHSIYGVSYRTQYVGKIKELMKSSALDEFGMLGWIYYKYYDSETIIYYHPYGWFMLFSTRLCVDDPKFMCTTIWESIKTNVILDFIQ
jgi:hypothetical protein